MRIIAGRHKGKHLAALGPKCGNLRPTSDMAREALFSILERWPKGAFLDVFSGTGAVALEAVSRGYSPVWCVERDKSAIAIIRANGNGTDLNVIQKDARNINKVDFNSLSVIFSDPPYDDSLQMWDTLAKHLSGFLSGDGVLVWECPKTLDLPEVSGLIPVDERRYGAAKFLFFEVTANHLNRHPTDSLRL
jgi:16S rRNA (guanine966-N2)-methyltransferase